MAGALLDITTIVDHDPEETLDYGIDWRDWLRTGDTLASVTVTVLAGTVTIGSGAKAPAISGTESVWWLVPPASSGTAKVRVAVTSTNGRIGKRTVTLAIRTK